MTVQHSAKSVEWGTPDLVLDLARELFGGEIDFDPCSSPAFNQRVQAKTYMSEFGEATAWPYPRSVLVNPPGNRPHEDNMPAKFWATLMAERVAVRFGHAIWIGFTLEHMRHCQSSAGNLIDFSFVVPRERLKFVRPDGSIGTSPGHANVIAYVPGYIDRTYKFKELFSELGAVRV